MKPATRKSATGSVWKSRDAAATFLPAPLRCRVCHRLLAERRISRQPKRHSSVRGVPSDTLVTTFAVWLKRRQFPLLSRDWINGFSQPTPSRISEAQAGVHFIVPRSSAPRRTLHLRLVSRRARGSWRSLSTKIRREESNCAIVFSARFYPIY